MAREFSRQDRVKKAMIREVSDVIANEVKDPRMADQVVSVTDIDLAKDFSHAKVYVSVFGDDQTQQMVLELLEEFSPKIRTQVGRRLKLRNTTKLVFHIDDSLERGTRVNQLLKQIAEEETND